MDDTSPSPKRSEQSSVPFLCFFDDFFISLIFRCFPLFIRLICLVQLWSVSCTHSRYSEGQEPTRRIGALPTPRPKTWSTSCWRFARTRPKTTVNRSFESKEANQWRQRVDAGIRFTFVSPCTSTVMLLPEVVFFSFDNTSRRTSLLPVPSMNQTLSQSSWFTVPG